MGMIATWAYQASLCWRSVGIRCQPSMLNILILGFYVFTSFVRWLLVSFQIMHLMDGETSQM